VAPPLIPKLRPCENSDEEINNKKMIETSFAFMVQIFKR
jgi:hypothetical protein